MFPGVRRALVVASMGVFFATVAQAQLGGPKAVTEFVFQSDAAHAGSIYQAAFTVELPKGLHTNSNTPLEDYLIPTVLSFETPEGIVLAEIAYPEAIHLKTGGSDVPLAVYEETFAIGAAFDLPADLSPGAYPLKGKFRYQACDEKSCFPPKTIRFESEIVVAPTDRPLVEQHSEVFASIEFTGAAPPVDTAPDTTQATTKPVVEQGDVMAQLEDFEILGTTGGYLKVKPFLKFIADAEAGVVRKGAFEGLGPIAIVLLVLVGGVALNLTPCVLPIIPINLAIIGAGAQAGSRARGFALGGTYGLAMAVVYGVLGLVVILTAGTFGAINSTLWFNAGIAILFVVLALAMFDVIVIDFSRLQTKFNLSGGKTGSFALAFGMGGISALLAGACVAPIVIQVIVFSSDLYAKGTAIALALPFMLGLGMALPWPFAGGGMSFLPKPGAWMVRVKQAMGVFILGFAIYYAYLGYKIYDNRNVDASEVQGSVAELLEGGWTPSLSNGLTTAKAEGKLVLVDMWATWCKNCLVMDKKTLKDAEVVAALEGYVKVKFQAEDLDTSPAKEVIQHLGGVGLPTYAILRLKSSGEATD